MRANLSLNLLFSEISTLLSSHMMNQYTSIDSIKEDLLKCSTLIRKVESPKETLAVLQKIKYDLLNMAQTVEDIDSCFRQYLSTSLSENASTIETSEPAISDNNLED